VEISTDSIQRLRGPLMVQTLTDWTRAIQSFGNPWVLTAGCGILFAVGSRLGTFYTPPSRIASVQASGDERAVLRFVTAEAIKNLVFFGAITLLVVRWDRWWLTGPAALLMAAVQVPQLLQDVIILGGTIPVAIARPRSAIFNIASTLVRLSGDLILLIALAVVITALLT